MAPAAFFLSPGGHLDSSALHLSGQENSALCKRKALTTEWTKGLMGGGDVQLKDVHVGVKKVHQNCRESSSLDALADNDSIRNYGNASASASRLTLDLRQQKRAGEGPHICQGFA